MGDHFVHFGFEIAVLFTEHGLGLFVVCDSLFEAVDVVGVEFG